MKKILSISVAALLAFGFYAFKGEGEKYPTLEIGNEAPLQSYEMNSPSGDSYSLNSLMKANGLLVIFSCNTCPFVIAWEDRYPELFELTQGKEMGFALINSNEAKREGDDSMEAMADHAADKGYSDIPYLVDVNSKLANAFGAKTTPHVFLFDRDMKLVYEGAIDDNHKDANKVKEQYLNKALMSIERGEKIKTPKTKAIGCSIKRVNI